MKFGAQLIAVAIVTLIGTIILFSSAYTVQETEQVIITQFGRPVGTATNSGLHFKLPFIQEINSFEKRILPWDGDAIEMPTKDKTYVIVDAFGRWRIKDPLKYFEKLRDSRGAESRLDDILGSEILSAVASHELIEVIRTTKDRVPLKDDTPNTTTNIGVLYSIERGRSLVEQDIEAAARPKLADFGIELLDVRFKRINYNETVRREIYQRMITERQRIAKEFRSEGEEKAAEILGNMKKDLQEIESEAYKDIQKIRGDADAEAADIYSGAYNQSPESIEFYNFMKTMEAYKAMLTNDTTLVLSTDSDLFKFFKGPEAQLK
ncbi:MAG: HflC protein [Verrucomicrobiales bacterium]|nr:HflC protein [Verrucomicrobiales bacterium]|tara:strand:+ start:26037 stop:26999 length:963 start_codon:yes stop_codon:yes gene_type:complete